MITQLISKRLIHLLRITPVIQKEEQLLLQLVRVQEVTIDQIRENNSEGKPSLLGSQVKFTGTVTAGFGTKELYVQDAKGGVNLYGDTLQMILIISVIP